jgi:chloramphenicol 3-O-phosphotransferase
MREPSIILITGIMAAGKSTVAQQLAERLPKSVHLRGDVFRRMIVNGRAEMEADFSESAWAQLRLRYQLAAAAAQRYCAAGFTVVYQDVIIGDVLKDVVEMLKTALPLYVIVLIPSVEVVVQREAGRGKAGYDSWTPEVLDHALRSNTPRLGLWLDTSALTVEETVDTILAKIEEAVI